MASAAGESLRTAAASKAEEAKLAALRGARHTGAAVGLAVRRAVGLAAAQVQRIINDSSLRLMQTVADLATRTVSRQVKADVETKTSDTERRELKKLSGKGTDSILKKHCERQDMK
ncbi:uncharacterized protein LOC127749904 [Frankliniella occidentalis]|uniref:Uncharacterized protein LOC127749904 n=1 Tax=Frankliniella occidentalis TaxID=133901 RepID=A0A9C6U454_FRAOC|nr:uncharacterized protein LOC127749904 [Frankliniella occidentalis]